MRIRAVISRAVVVLALLQPLAILPASETAAVARKPLLMDGKKTLARKVLMRPGAQISTIAGTAGTTLSLPFSVNFVYAEKVIGQTTWLEIGPDQSGTIAGWVPIEQTAEWRQSMTLAFTNPAGRERTLFFKNREELEEFIGSSDLLVQAESFREKIRRGNLPEDSPVISVEPENHIDIQEHFYLLPILEAEEIYLNSGFPTTLLKVSSVSDEAMMPTSKEPPTGPKLSEQEMPPDLRSAVTFVIDATSSMGPYIEQVRAVAKDTFNLIQSNSLLEHVRFGLVAYRDSTDAAPGLEYASKKFADPNTVLDGDTFLKQVSDLAPASVSSKGFVEDAYSGVVDALTSIDWAGYAGRFVILITDAGAREGNDPLSGTGMSTEQIRQLALSQNAYVYVLHLQTSEGKADHQSAASQYTSLATMGDGSGRSLYYAIPSGDPKVFGEIVRDLARQITEHIRAFRDGKDRADQEAEIEQARKELENAENEEERLEKGLKYQTALVGLAIRLTYVGERDGDKAPSMFSAWLTDRSFRNPDRSVVGVRVLLTKNQLSDLQETLQRVLEASEKGQLAPDALFSSLRAAAAAMGRAPAKIKGAQNIKDLGLIGEYLDGLPYRSQVMNISQDIWTSWSIGQQQQFIDTISSKIKLYREYHDNTENWVFLNPTAPAGEAVYPVPLDALP